MESIFDDILRESHDIDYLSPKNTSDSSFPEDPFLIERIERIKNEAKNEARIEFCNVYMKNELYYQEQLKSLVYQLHTEQEKNKMLTDSCYTISKLAKEYKDKYEILLKDLTGKTSKKKIKIND
jgi:hypothetical protein